MNIYLISQVEQDGYDTYDSAVVMANNEEEARNTSPSTGFPMEWHGGGAWASSADKVKVEFLGVAVDGSENGVVCASFNAG